MCRRSAGAGDAPGEAPGQGSFESAALAIHVVNAEGLIVEVNRAFEIMFGASRRLFLGKHNAILGVGPAAAGLRLLDGIRSGVNQQGIWHGTLQSERFCGTHFQSRAHVYPMRVGERPYLVFFQEELHVAAKAQAPQAFRAREPALAAMT